MINMVNAAVIRDGDLLIVKEKGRNLWILPGGEILPGETEEQCLSRKLYGESAEINPKKAFTFFKRIESESPDHNDVVSVAVYIINAFRRPDIESCLRVKDDLAGIVWAYDPVIYHLSDVTWKIAMLLRREGHIKKT